MTLLLAVALVFNLPAALQRAIPDYTSSLENKLGGDQKIQEALNLGGVDHPFRELRHFVSLFPLVSP